MVLLGEVQRAGGRPNVGVRIIDFGGEDRIWIGCPLAVSSRFFTPTARDGSVALQRPPSPNG